MSGTRVDLIKGIPITTTKTDTNIRTPHAYIPRLTTLPRLRIGGTLRHCPYAILVSLDAHPNPQLWTILKFHTPLEPEVIARLDEIFFSFLQRICSDLTACDAKGDHIHQPLMAKKMERLEASTDFRPFKFRIQAFTNAFHDSLIQHGLTEDVLPLRKVKLYLWKHRYISRFNEDGKKQKSKGNHVWNIEARKISNIVPVVPVPGSSTPDASSTSLSTPRLMIDSSAASTPPSSTSSSTTITTKTTTTTGYGSLYDQDQALLPPDMDPKQIGPEAISAAGGGLGIVRRPTCPVRWEFREYSSRIAGHIIKLARVGVPYVYSPRIWDAQMSCPAAKYSSPWLPSWLKWHRGELKGIPTAEADTCTIVVVAEYVREGEDCRLEMSFPLTVTDPSRELPETDTDAADGTSAVVVDGGGHVADGDGQGGLSEMNDEDDDMEEDEDMMDDDHEPVFTHTHPHTHSNFQEYQRHHYQPQQQKPQPQTLQQQEHQREQRQAQKQFQRLQLQEQPATPSFQPTSAPSSASTTSTSFFPHPPSSLSGSISSSRRSSNAVIEETEEDEYEEGEDEYEEEEGMESVGVEGNERKHHGHQQYRRTGGSHQQQQRRKASQERRSLILSQENKRRKHE
ncbi:hypothetical protein BGX29_009391 [Mortierella sp. GBA35]|nr:hypothetical protein BGX29_009391 [Mortierella sp. GBA35]